MTATQKNVKLLFNTLSALGIAATIILCVYWYKLGIFTSTDTMTGFISNIGRWGVLVFVAIQIIGVVIPPIPGGLVCLAGVVLFGPVYGFWYNYIGISIGSVINFILARKYGKPLIKSMTSEKIYQKYIGWLDKGKKFDTLFAWAIFFPVAPDDFLCLLAGITKMTLKKFVAIILLCKPFSTLLYSIGFSTVTALLTGAFS